MMSPRVLHHSPESLRGNTKILWSSSFDKSLINLYKKVTERTHMSFLKNYNVLHATGVVRFPITLRTRIQYFKSHN